MVGRLGLLRCSIDRFWLLSAHREHLSILGVPGERGPRHGRLWHSAVAEDFLQASSRRVVPSLWRANPHLILHLHSEVVFTAEFHCLESFIVYDEFAHFDSIKRFMHLSRWPLLSKPLIVNPVALLGDREGLAMLDALLDRIL